MTINFTEKQKQAIHSKNRFIVVNSSAGTGKTTILVERVLDLLMKGKEIKRILVLTFTNNVAKEIIERLWSKLYRVINSTDHDLNSNQLNHLKNQLFELPNAYISTFHSFCKRSLEEKIFQSKELEIINELEFYQILQSTSNKVIKEWMAYKSNYPILYKLTKFHDPKLLQMIKTLYKQALYRGTKFEEFIKYNLDLYKNPISLKKNSNSKRENLLNRSIVDLAPKEFLNEIETNIFFIYHYYYISNFIIENKLVSYGSIIKKRLSFNDMWKEFTKLGSNLKKNNWVDDFRKNLWTCYQFALNKYKGKPEFIFLEKLLTLYYVKNDNYFKMNDILKKEYKTLYKLIIEINNEIKKEMKKLNLFSFDDLIYLFWDNFQIKDENESLRSFLVENFDHILIDEFQDTSIYQYNFIKSLEKSRINILIVGDSKQSIYRFQGAIPSLFEEVRNKAMKWEDGEVIPLRNNFRSNQNIVRFVNTVFTFLWKKIGLDSQFRYEKEDHLICTKKLKQTSLSIEELLYNKKNLYPHKDEQINVLITTFFDIYKRIKKSQGKLKYSDFMILTRNNFKFKNINYVSKLFHIPIRGRYKQLVLKEYSFYSIFYHAMRTIFSPHDDVSLLSTLKYVFSINDRDLIDIKIQYHKTNKTKSPYLDGSFFVLLKDFVNSKNSNNELKVKINYFLETLNSIQEYFRDNSLITSIKHFLFQLDFFKKISSYQPIEESMKWWEIITNKLNVVTPLKKTLKGFIDILDEGDLNEKSELDFHLIQNENAVFIMTVHSAKGLEAKHVYYLHSTNASNKFKNVDDDIGINTVFESEIVGKKIKTPQKIFIDEKEKLLTIYDTLRLFYVICTRPKDSLIFVRKKTKTPSKKKSFNDVSSFNSINNLITIISNQKFYKTLVNTREATYKSIKDFLVKTNKESYMTKEKKDYKNISPLLQPKTIIKESKEKRIIKKEKDIASDSILFGLNVHKTIEIVLKQMLTYSHLKNIDFEKLVDQSFDIGLEYLKILEEEEYIKRLRKYSLSFFLTKKFREWFSTNNSKFYSEVPVYINKQTKEIGRIDLLIIENNKVIIIDFKTDKLESKNDFIERHKMQLIGYANSLKTHYQTIELFIYSTHLNEFININL